MTSGIAYPRRDDAVRYEKFDGTLESAQRIANLTGLVLHIKVAPNRSFLPGDVLSLAEINVNADRLRLGDYVVKSRTGQGVIVPADDFHDKYSKDGN
ncbi:hypothetical protein J4U00_gp072 [Mycobacterium phage DyoEdafos]|uniref:Uncharacterized protein n=1 Tax=Mycobacterium phage DyoEdafos TaxID=2599860 RepID=A0A5J6THP6_9CAUD|nr:hypothetical protein J4U00_gp072 [Mycobacterium phage DyoEdafos]QFG10300.1 hypothetical protein SEA_DYOEDAFOS_72 [Mycobacterium phage DyoEdafos]